MFNLEHYNACGAHLCEKPSPHSNKLVDAAKPLREGQTRTVEQHFLCFLQRSDAAQPDESLRRTGLGTPVGAGIRDSMQRTDQPTSIIRIELTFRRIRRSVHPLCQNE